MERRYSDNWRYYVVNAMRDYLRYREIRKAAQNQRITAQFNKGRGGKGVSRTTESAALRTGLTRQQEKEFDAVDRAIHSTRHLPDGKLRVKVVDLVYLRGTHTIDGAAQIVHVSYRTARRWTDSFIREVGKNLGCE